MLFCAGALSSCSSGTPELSGLSPQAQAEIRRAAAVALEQEMKAKVVDMKAKVIEAESQVPLALAESLRSGKMGFMDYYKLQNIQADTTMRESISGDAPKK